MSVEENVAMARRYEEEVLSGKDPAAIDDYVTTDYYNSLIPPGIPQGPAGEKLTLGMFAQAFPDFRIIVEDTVGEGDKVAIRWRFVGTHGGDFQGLPATGRHVDVPGINIFHMRDGKFCENWVTIDMLGLMQQLGAIPAPAGV